jgi:cytochrome P450/NADPH-cytochrome P450 reductase
MQGIGRKLHTSSASSFRLPLLQHADNKNAVHAAPLCCACQVLENRELQGPGSDRSTRHVQLQLPAGPAGQYSSGEHLEVYGNNDGSLVEAALKLLNMSGARLSCFDDHAVSCGCQNGS